MEKWKIWLIIVSAITIILTAMGVTIYSQQKKIEDLTSKWENAVINNKAFEEENNKLNGRVVEFQYSVDQLNYSVDSLTQKLNGLRKQLGIKDKQILELQHLSSENVKTEYVHVHDTIFKENVVLDTLIKDDWSSLALHAEFPNIINASYSFNNETSVLIFSKKETVDPPKKCWLGRLFQKKHEVIEVEVVQENPYCTNKNEKFIKIIEK